MAMITVHWLGWRASAAIDRASSSDGIESSTSTTRMTKASMAAAEGPGEDAEHQAADQADQRGAARRR